MDNVKTKTVMDGRLEVHNDGRIYHIKPDGSRVEAIIQKPGTFSIYEGGRQKHYIARRVIAEAFLPNPDNCPYVSNLDGDATNNCIENLKWTSKREQVEKVKQKRQKICMVCGDVTYAADAICTKCRQSDKKARRAEAYIMAADKKINGEMAAIDLSLLTPLERQTVEYRKQNLTYDEIAGIMGCTRQCIDQRIKRAKEKTVAGPRRNKMQAGKITALKNKLAVAKCNKECLKNKMDDVDCEIRDLERKIAWLAGAEPGVPVQGS